MKPDTGTTRPASSAGTGPEDAFRRPGRGAWIAMIRSEARLVARDTAGLLLPIGVPVLFMVMSGLGSDGQALPELGGLSGFDAVAVPSTLVMILAMLGLINVPAFLATHRQYGVLRRLSATPARPAMVMVAQVLVNLALGAIGIASALLVATFAFSMSGPRSLGWAALAMGMGAMALYAAGLVVAAIARTANAGLALGLVAFFAMMASGGGMLPAENLPAVVATVGEYLPFGAALHALRDSWVGTTPSAVHLAVLVGTTVVSLAVASRVFRWD